MKDVEGITWNNNPEDELRYKHLNNGVHMFMLFLGTSCNVCNIQYSLPTSYKKYRVFMMHIKRCIMDAGWGIEPSTIKNHLLEANINVIRC